MKNKCQNMRNYKTKKKEINKLTKKSSWRVINLPASRVEFFKVGVRTNRMVPTVHLEGTVALSRAGATAFHYLTNAID